MKETPKFSDFVGKGKNLNYRQFFMICILLFITVADILMDYVHAGFDATVFQQAAYWVELALSLFSVIFITLATRDFFRTKELTSNFDIITAQNKIRTAHAELINRDMVTKFESYVDKINHERKLKAYMDYLRRKIFTTDRKKEYWHKRLETASVDIEFLKTVGRYIKVGTLSWVKYIPIKTTTIFADVDIGDDDEDDLSGNEPAHISKMLTKKVTLVFAIFFSFSTLFFTSSDVGLGVVVSTAMKLFRIAASVYTGASDGISFIQNIMLNKMQRRLDFIQKFLEQERQQKSASCATQ